MNDKRLLVVDDNPQIGRFIETVARDAKFEVRVACTRIEFESAFRSLNPTFVFLDLAMPDADGIELIRYLADKQCTARIAVISGFDTKVLNAALRLGKEKGLNMAGALQKPISIDDIESLLSGAPDPRQGAGLSEIEAAITNQQMVVYYQPKIELAERRGWHVKELEALVRWKHPQRGVIGPDAFLPRIDNPRVLSALTSSVIDSVLAQILDWEAKGHTLNVAVNIAPQLLGFLELPDEIAQLTAQRGIGNDRLTLEITETGTMQDTARAMDILTRFRVKGFQISIDDFGTGYSSLIQLLRMPFSELKIDKSFVMESDRSEEARTIVHTSVELAHNLGMKVCAEGVESQVLLDFVAAAGCELAQGYHMSRPIPGDDVPDLLNRWQAAQM